MHIKHANSTLFSTIKTSIILRFIITRDGSKTYHKIKQTQQYYNTKIARKTH